MTPVVPHWPVEVPEDLVAAGAATGVAQPGEVRAILAAVLPLHAQLLHDLADGYWPIPAPLEQAGPPIPDHVAYVLAWALWPVPLASEAGQVAVWERHFRQRELAERVQQLLAPAAPVWEKALRYRLAGELRHAVYQDTGTPAQPYMHWQQVLDLINRVVLHQQPLQPEGDPT